jgi:hypothetical protein
MSARKHTHEGTPSRVIRVLDGLPIDMDTIDDYQTVLRKIITCRSSACCPHQRPVERNDHTSGGNAYDFA